MMSEGLAPAAAPIATNRDTCRHVDVKVHFLRDLVRDGHIKFVKCDGTQNVSDALTKSLSDLDWRLRNIRNIWLVPDYLSQLFYHLHRGKVK
jgi:hypothetical protein